MELIHIIKPQTFDVLKSNYFEIVQSILTVFSAMPEGEALKFIFHLSRNVTFYHFNFFRFTIAFIDYSLFRDRFL